MANLKIDNFSGDTISVTLNEKSFTAADGKRITVENLEKGIHTLTVSRTRLLAEQSAENRGEEKDLLKTTERESRSLHTQLSCTYEIEINSSRCMAEVTSNFFESGIRAIDALFSGYRISLTGAKLINQSQSFASKKVRGKFIAHHLKNALLPVGAGGIILLFAGFYAIGGVLAGSPVNLGGREFTMPWAVGLSAAGVGFVGYAVYAIARALITAKKFSKPKRKSNNI